MTTEPTITREIPQLPARNEDAHKGDVGRLLVIGGCASPTMMIGAPALTAKAAFRCGAGLVQLVVPAEVQQSVATLAECATSRALVDDGEQIAAMAEAFSAGALAIGPGLGTSLSADALTGLAQRFAGGLVIDADGLNTLAAAGGPPLHHPARLIITPHPGEAARLLRARDLTPPGNNATQRRQTAMMLHEAYGCTVVLKGRDTVVTDGDRLYINQTGNSGMATGGTGDVLTGVLLAMIGQGMEIMEAAILGTYLHGLAGDYAAEELGRHSMTASDMLRYLPEVFRDHDLLEPS